MAVGTRSRDAERAVDVPGEAAVLAFTSSPGRMVFVEDGNSDGWIASDVTVTPSA